MLTLALFLSFLIVEAVLVWTKRATECGCYGVAYSQKVDGTSIAVSTLFVGLAALQLWALGTAGSVDMRWRLVGIVPFAVVTGWILRRMARRRRRAHRLTFRTVSPGDHVTTWCPAESGFPMASRVLTGAR